ncbi:MAG: hypothetical protein VB104_11350 [Candidatus Limiplasma sp.]|nr:hypothetical protein [Candidatus Limiplasma sp.]
MNELEMKFHQKMMDTYLAAKKLKYNASYFYRMLTEMGGYEAAKQLIHAESTSDGFARLWELKRLDLSVEYIVLKPEYRSLFSDEERAKCAERLKQNGFRF